MIEHHDKNVEAVGQEIADRLGAIEAFFKPGVKITFLARFDGLPEQDMFITSDSIEQVRDAVDRAAARKEWLACAFSRKST